MGVILERRWKNRNVNIDLLVNSLVDFFKEMDFGIVKGKTSTGYAIIASDSSIFQINGYVTVEIEGKPEDFTIKFEVHEEESGTRFFSPLLMTMFGGGYFLSKRLKSREACIRLEREFWNYVERILP